MNLGRLAWNAIVSRNSKNMTRQSQAISQLIKKGNLVFNLTTRCNFSCKHCMRNLADPKDFPIDILKKIITEAKTFKFNHISLTGGEPLLYPRLRECMDAIVENDFALILATNGFILEDFFDIFKKNKKNIQHIQFSLEDADPKRHDEQRRAGSFKKILQGAQFCRDNKIPFRFMTAVSTLNIANIFDIALFAKKKGAFALAVSTVLPCPRSQNNHLVLSEKERSALFLNALELSNYLRFPIALTAAVRTQDTIRLCSGLNLNEIAFDVDGNLVQCCDLANYDDDEIHASSYIASAKNKTFGEMLLEYSDYAGKFDIQRIRDYQRQADPNAANFNSCFYCLNKLKNNV